MQLQEHQLESIWLEYKEALKAFLHSKVADHADVEDLLQQILIKTHHNLAKVREAGSIKAWLFQVANNAIIDFYRAKGRKAGHEEALVAEDLWYGEAEQDIKAELSHCIEPFIQRLPEAQAELLTQFDLLGESQKQYAEQHDIRYSTLKSRLQKARNELRGLFDQCCAMQLDAQGNLMDYDAKQNDCGCS